MKKFLFIALIISLLIFVYLSYGLDTSHKVIKNAYVSGRVVIIKSNINGQIAQLKAKKGAHIDKGALLLSYDTTKMETSISNLKEKLKISIRKELETCVNVSLLTRRIELNQLEKAFSEDKTKRARLLSHKNVLSVEELEEKDLSLQLSRINLKLLNTELTQMVYKNSENFVERPAVQLIINELKNAYFQRSKHSVYAPYNGYVYALKSYLGMYTEPGDELLVFIPKENALIEANILESELRYISVGKEVEIVFEVSGEANKEIKKGYIYSIVPSVAATFSAIPINNIDSNWIKVSQRVPILIKFQEDELNDYPFGSSVTVKIPKVGGKLINLDDTVQSSSTMQSLKSGRWQDEFESELNTLINSELTAANNVISECRLND